ncbi:hypothetical protein DPMN_036747 [Dreissena polymorpha]|uniref:Uncharacterized protein n=1 Tax=Dreissena polymorpha TaxID=45954 RepID=A0A9D4RP57_DREPO|nr:hypothetical protein DPMN_036631 [Dreissena polymorpha]KAH3873510.1 hypothetical protein DPMN_036747 [Dreissena polymorpha]
MTIFNEDRTKYVTSRLLTRFHYSHILETAPPPGNHLSEEHILTKFHVDLTINVTSRVFELGQEIIQTNILTKFREDRKINLASRVANVDDAQRMSTRDKWRS